MPYRVDAGLVNTLKRVAAIFKQADVPFALGGSFAVYAHGGYSSDHDVDFMIREQDVDRALEELTAAGFTSERPPEDWLVKVYDDGRMVDLIFRPVETPVTDETLADSVVRPVDAIQMPCISATQLMVHKLLSFSQHYCDFARGLPVARSLREQIDWRACATRPRTRRTRRRSFSPAGRSPPRSRTRRTRRDTVSAARSASPPHSKEGDIT